MNQPVTRSSCRAVLSILLILLFISCENQTDYTLQVPDFSGSSKLLYSAALSDSAKYSIEGIYRVTRGSDVFGDTLVMKQTRDKISLFGNKNGCYIILDAGIINDQIILEGYWRYALNDGTGLVSLTIIDATQLIEGNTKVNSITLTGQYGNGNSMPGTPLTIELIKKFSNQLRSDPFIIGAHRAGGRTSDLLPASENSVAMIKYTEYFGSTGIEIDVTLTKDKIPVLYHDNDLNIRLIQKGPLYGAIHDYTLAQLRSMVKLIHGEDIPTLEEAFATTLNDTKLKFIWMDIKDPESIPTVIQLQRKYLDLARNMGRDLRILIGVPVEEIYRAFKSNQDYQNIPSLCELSADSVTALNSQFWAFRWTMGLQEPEVLRMHEQGRKCLVWTLDVPKFTEIYTTCGGTDATRRFDGLLTNYPSILAYYHYVRHNF
jgi:glycerophosphoryl diester phosphodiesterase